MTKNSDTWSLVLVGCLWAVVCGFSVLCWDGYRSLDLKIAAAEQSREREDKNILTQVLGAIDKLSDEQSASSREIGEIKTMVRVHMKETKE